VSTTAVLVVRAVGAPGRGAGTVAATIPPRSRRG
jgi:hypothetical protein